MGFRSRIAATLAVLVTVGLPVTSAQAVTAPQVTQAPAAHSTVNFTTIIDQWTHWSPDAYNSTHAGTLYAGTSYFYCWNYGNTYSNNGRTSDLWLLTDDDTGNRNVYVSSVNLDSWGYYHLQQNLVRC
ncbi:hypothetical protein ACWC6I_21665 [Streptomyces sp. NPDC001414]